MMSDSGVGLAATYSEKAGDDNDQGGLGAADAAKVDGDSRKRRQ